MTLSPAKQANARTRISPQVLSGTYADTLSPRDRHGVRVRHRIYNYSLARALRVTIITRGGGCPMPTRRLLIMRTIARARAYKSWARSRRRRATFVRQPYTVSPPAPEPQSVPA